MTRTDYASMPETFHTRRRMWLYVTARHWLEKGMAELRFLTYFLYVIGVERAVSDRMGQAVLLGFAYFGACIVAGFLWDWFGCFSVEAEWKNQRNPLSKELRTALRKGVEVEQ